MPQPWEKYRAGPTVATMPPAGPKPPPGFAPASTNAPIAFQPGGPEDPAVIAAQARAKAEADAEAAIRVAAARDAMDRAAEKEKAEQAKAGKIADLTQRDANLMSLANQLISTELSYDRNFRGGIPNFIAGVFPSAAKEAFNKESAALLDVGQAAFRIPGSGDQNAQEMKFKLDAYKPSPTASDAANDVNFNYLRSRIDTERKAFSLPPINWASLRSSALADQSANPNEVANFAQPLAPPTLTVSRDGSGVMGDPNAGVGMRTAVATMLQQGKSQAEIEGFLKAQGVEPSSVQGLDDVLQWRARNPGYKGSFSINPLLEQSAPSVTGQFFNSPAAEFARGAFNGLAPGALDEITGGMDSLFTGRPLSEAIAEANLRKQAGAEAFPTSNAIGNAIGGLGASLGIGAAVPKAVSGLAANRLFAPQALLGDAGYGALFGAGEDNEDRLGGALDGAKFGAAGGVAGRGMFAGGGKLLTGARGASQDLLSRGGMNNLTIGQRVGGRLKVMEDKLSGTTLIGDLISKRRGEGMADFNLGTFRQFDPSISATGPEGIKQAGQVVKKTYADALDGVDVPIDDIYNAAQKATNLRGSAIPGLSEDYQYILANKVGPIAGASDTLTGRQAQDMIRVLRRQKAAYGKQASSGANPKAADMVSALQEVEDNIMGLLNRQSPGTVLALDRANKLYAQKKILEDAVIAGRNTGDIFTPAQLGNSMLKNTRMFGGSTKAAEGNMPFFDWQRAGQEVLPSAVPNSGTADRAMAALLLPSVLGGAGAGLGVIDPSTAAMIASLSLPFTKTGQKAAGKLLSGRSDRAISLGEEVRKKMRLGGMFGASLSAQTAVR